MLLETNYSSEAFKENINISLLLTGSFPPKPLKTTAHGLPKISRNLSSNGPTFGKKYKKGFLFSNIGIKQGKMGTETSKISSNGPTFGKKYKKGFLFSNIGIKQGKMGTETSKIALNAHVHLRTANQQMSRPERHVDDTLTCTEVAGFVRTLPAGVHSARRLGCLRSLLTVFTAERCLL